jgi:hypothetical protein
MKRYKGDLVAIPGTVYDFEEITGTVDARGADTRAAFPKLTTVGGGVDARGADTRAAFPKLTTTQADPSYLATAFALQGLEMCDGILSRLVSRRGNVARVAVVGQSQISYLVRRGDTTAHGATLQLARADLLFKLGSKDTSQFQAWTLKTRKPVDEMIAAYRVITGACQFGVSRFMAEKQYGATISVAAVIKETRGQYGHAQFSKFFTQDKAQ